MAKSRKMQLKAMNEALENFAGEVVVELDMLDANSIKQSVVYNEPYNSIEVYKSNQIYKTMIDVSNTILTNVKDKKEETERKNS